jgi:acetyl esterase/lipase
MQKFFAPFFQKRRLPSFPFAKRHKMKFIPFLAVLLAACSPASLLNATISRAGTSVTHNVAYGPDPRQTLDIYRPDGAALAPVIVFFYGGSWNSGNKAMYPFVAATLARQGNIVVVPDYRLYPQVRFPLFLQDCARAVAWTQAHLREIGGDPARVFMMGHSAGAYNAVMLALDPTYLQQAGTSRAQLAGVIGLAGPYDFLPITGADIKPIFATVADGPQSQPITYVDGHAPPLLLLAGSADTTVLPRNTLALAAKVRAHGGYVEDRIFPGVAHIGLVIAIAPVFQGKAPVLPAIEAFIHAHALPSEQLRSGARGAE